MPLTSLMCFLSKLPFPQVIFPGIREVDNVPGGKFLRRVAKTVLEHRLMNCRVANIPQGKTEWMLDIERSGRLDKRGHLSHQR
jgi:hypothetical protein